jgi:hypothetical protein
MNMDRIRLTNQRIESATVNGQKSRTGKSVNQVFLWDTEARGLGVRVTDGGAKSYIFQGKIKDAIRITIGPCNAWSLSDARTEARRLHTLIDKGIDPREQEKEKQAEKAAKKAATEANQKYTLRALLKAYADHLEARGKIKSAKAARSVIKVHILEADPSLADKPATGITSYDVAALIRRAHEKGKERTAGILRSTISAAYNCGRRAPFDTELPSLFIKFNIVSNPVDVIPTIAVKAGNRTLSNNELKNYMAALGADTVDMALKLALFSGGQRMAELLRAQVTDWNADTKTLRLLDPKGKRKQPREHLLPLGPVASSIVKDLTDKAAARESNSLFASGRKSHVHDTTPGPRVTEIATAIGSEPFDLRDLRRTVETMLASLGVSRDIRAQLLSHGISGVQAQHYDRHDYLKEKHVTLIKWERHLTRIASGEEESKVVQLR